MIDFHCHLDLYQEPMKTFREVNRRNIQVLAVTTSPRAFVQTSKFFFGLSNVRVALGFHPELVAQRPSEKKQFFEQMRYTRFIGEIGLDGSQRAKGTLLEQKNFLNEVLRTAALYGGKIISIHSRGAVKEVLQTLETYKGDYIPILHWFTGSTTEAQRAIRLGCWFSINPNMCFTNTGKRIISCIPIDRVLPETDGPFVQIDGMPYMPWDTTVIEYLAKENNMKLLEMDELLSHNLKKLLG